MKTKTKNETISSEIMKISVARELFPVAVPGESWLSVGTGEALEITVGVGEVMAAGASKVNEYVPSSISPSMLIT